MTQQRDTDNGYAALVKNVFKLGAPKIAFGIFAEDAAQPADADGNVTILDIASWQEFGTEHIPERSFLRAWFDQNQERAVEVLRRLLQSVVEGKRTPDQALKLFGEWALGEIKQRIAQGIPPPNAESTVRQKGSSTPLIDTGQLRSSVTYGIDLGSGMKVVTSEGSHARTTAAKKAIRKAASDKRKARKQAIKAAKKAARQTTKAAARGAKKTLRRIRRLVKKRR